jgi:hypothetical protein
LPEHFHVGHCVCLNFMGLCAATPSALP